MKEIQSSSTLDLLSLPRIGRCIVSSCFQQLNKDTRPRCKWVPNDSKLNHGGKLSDTGPYTNSSQ